VTTVDANADPILPICFFCSSPDLVDQDALQTDPPCPPDGSVGFPVLYLKSPGKLYIQEYTASFLITAKVGLVGSIEAGSLGVLSKSRTKTTKWTLCLLRIL
jgi:hypothetical protein